MTADIGVAKRFPDLDYTSKQLFWLTYGRLWCVKYRPIYLDNLVRNPNKPHPPGPVRVNGALTNIDQFANDFNCPRGSKMNPETKCPRIW